MTLRILPPFVTSRSPLSAVPAWKTSAPACSASSIPSIGDPDVVAGRVVAGREDDGDRGIIRDLEIDAGEIACRRCGERPEQVAVEAREQRLRLGIAETAVELEHARPVVGEHQPGEEDADEGNAASGELLEHGPVDRVQDLLDLRRAEAGHR